MIERQRKQLHEAFEKEHAGAHEKLLAQSKAFQKEQEQAVKNLNLTVWDLITKGPPTPQ